MTEDPSPENLRKFLESDDPAMVRMGISMAKGVNVEITVDDIGHFLDPYYEDEHGWSDDGTFNVEKVKIGIKLAEEAGIEEEAVAYFSESVNDIVETKGNFMIPTHKYDEESLFEILESIAEDEKYTERIAEILANFLRDHFDGEKRTGETELIYEAALQLLGSICNDKLREKHIGVLVSGALRDTYKFQGYPESDLNYTCMQILGEWDENQALIDTFLDYLYDAIRDGQPTNNELYNSILYGCQTSEEDLLENIPWEKAYILLTRRSLGMPSNDLVHFVTQEECDEMYCFHDGDLDIIKDNYELRPEWTVSTLKACLRKSEHKKFRDEAKKALEELGIND